MRYKCLKNCWHRIYQESFYPGEIIPLDHLTKKEIDILISKGIVVAAPKAPTPKPQGGIPKKREKAVPAVEKNVPVKPVLTGRKTTPIEPVIEKKPVIDIKEIESGICM